MGAYETALAALNSAQRKAVETIDGPVLVIAGPGTGKTQLLTTRVAHILAKTDTLPQNILCLTFTDSAAQTMRERLAGLIGQAAYSVTISTYHAFGSDIIRRFPDYFADEPALEAVDDLGIDRILRAAIAGLPYGNPLKFADGYISDVKNLISDAKRALLAPKDIRLIAQQNLDFIDQASPVVTESLTGLSVISKKSVALFEQLLGELEHRHLTFRETQPKRSPRSDPPRPAEVIGSAGVSRSVSGLPESKVPVLPELLLADLKIALRSAKESGKTTPLTAWKNQWLAKDQDNRFVVAGRQANQKLLALADLYEQYTAALKAQQLFDYDDMILRAVHTLETHDDLRYTLQEQYQYILLDEFQDTNGAQLRLVELLTDNPVNEGRPNVLAVGDDDQAVYAFQGADYSHMTRFTHMYRDVLAVPLTENYRSHADILDTAGKVADQIGERLHRLFPEIDKQLVARTAAPEAVVERREAASDVMQFGWVARRIAELVASGIPAKEIAVLAPQHKYLEPLIPFLHRAGLKARYDKRENILDDPGIAQLAAMARLVLAIQRGDRAAADTWWPEVLSFDFWQLPTSQIWQMSWRAAEHQRGWTDELLANENLKTAALFFIRLSLLARSETLETMLDYLTGSAPLDLNQPGQPSFTSPYYAHYFKSLDGAQRATYWDLLSNLIVLRARVHAYRREGDKSHLLLSDLIEFVDAHEAANLKLLNTSPYASGTDAVQLMTAYKAKGMEFTAVFVLAVQDEVWGQASRLQSRIGLPPNLQHIRYKGSSDDERLRLLYVAMTRAKAYLYLVNYRGNYAGRAAARLKYLNESPDDNGQIRSPLLPAVNQLILPAEADNTAPSTELAAYWHTRHEASLEVPELRLLLQDRLRRYQLSPTHLNDFIDLVHTGPQAFFRRTLLRFPQAPRPELQFGQVLHATLEWIHRQTKASGTVPSLAAATGMMERFLRGSQLSQQDFAILLERGKRTLRAYLEQRSDSFQPDDVAEYNFRHEGVHAGPAHLTGKIDKLIVDKQAKSIIIVDYKTGAGQHKWTADVKLHKYRQQLYLYKTLVEGSHNFAGYTVQGAYLEFVEPDDDGRIRQLNLPFDSAEHQQVKRLAEAVWRRITQLDLPDTSGYRQSLAGIKEFEADLIL